MVSTAATGAMRARSRRWRNCLLAGPGPYPASHPVMFSDVQWRRCGPLPSTQTTSAKRSSVCGFLLDAAVGQTGTDLGVSPDSRFDPEPRPIEVEGALAGIAREATSLEERLSELPDGAWESTVVLDGTDVDPDWIVRHAVHDASHHLLDIERLRQAL